MLRNEFDSAMLQCWPNSAPQRLSASAWEAISTIYQSRKGDTLFTGSLRHLRCAQWVRDNQPTVLRLMRLQARRRERMERAELARYLRTLAEHLDNGDSLSNVRLALRIA